MDFRTTVSGRRQAAFCRFRSPAHVRPAVYLGVAAAGAVMVNVMVGIEPAAQVEAATSESISVAQQLGLTADSRALDETRDLESLRDLAASRSTREAEETAAQQAQAAADQAELDRRKAEEEAAARAAAEAEAAARAAEAAKAAEAAEAAEAGRAADPATGTAATMVARISNTAGPVKPQAQAAANAVVSNVPGARGITIGGTRPSAADPGGHPSGLALDYMVNSDVATGNAIVDYHIANWEALGVEYVIYRQRMLSSPGGSWKQMEDRGSPTQNHMDHPHVNYR